MPFNTVVMLVWDEARFLVDASACAQEGGIELLISIAESRPVIVAILCKGFLLAGVGSQGKVKDVITNLSWNSCKKRRFLLWISIACVN